MPHPAPAPLSQSQSPPLKVGIVGYGYAAAVFHVPLVRAVPGLELAAVSSHDPAKVRVALPGIDVPATAGDLFARPDIDLVIIPTPNATHHPLAAQALEAGRHVVVDKPFTLDVAQAEDLIDRARRAGRLLSVFHNRRWDGDLLTLRRVLAAGTLGRITQVESHYDRYRPVVRTRWRDDGGPGSGLWYDLGPHLLDQALCLFGPPEKLSLDLACQRDGARTDDWFHAVLHYGALRVILHATTLAAAAGPRFVAHGTRGSFIQHGMDPQEDALKAGILPGAPGWPGTPGWSGVPGTATLTLAAAGGTAGGGAAGGNAAGTVVRRDVDTVPGDYTRYYAGVRDAIRRGSANPVPATEALQVMRLIALGQRSAAEGRVLAL